MTYNVLAGVRVHDDGGHWLWPAVQRRHDTAAPPAPRCPRVGAPPTAQSQAALQLLLVQQPLWEPRSGAKTHDETVAYGSRGIRVASEPTVGRDGLSSGRRRATRRDSNRGRGIGRLDETMSPVARGRVLSRIMIWRFLGIIAYLAQPKPAKAKLKSGPTTTNLNMARLRRGPRPARWPRKSEFETKGERKKKAKGDKG